MELPLKDKLDQPIEPGAIIAYGHALGRCAGLRIGKVVKIAIKEKPSWASPAEPEARITVQGVDDDWSGRPVELTSRKGTLMFPDRIIVLNPAAVPQRFLSLLESVKVEA